MWVPTNVPALGLNATVRDSAWAGGAAYPTPTPVNLAGTEQMARSVFGASCAQMLYRVQDGTRQREVAFFAKY